MPPGTQSAIANENRQFQYNDAGRLTQVTRQGTVRGTYSYNHQFQRTRKVKVMATGASRTFVYHYDRQGQLISETKEDGTPIRSYIWADNEPVAQIQYKPNQQTDQLLYVHTDHLATPRLATDSTQAAVWRFESQAFGQGQPDSDPDDDSINHFVRLRMAGQYYDGESGLFYNWNRYYDPKVGRYVTSDPVGLEGGLNTYAYVKANPLRWTDPHGLDIAGGWEPGGSIGNADIPYGLPGSAGSICGSGFKFPEFSFRDACQKHDDCYGTCGANKTWCDFRFQWNAQQSCAAGDWRCRLLAQAYFEAILHGGGGAYNQAQKEACIGCKQ